jgi:hypothetical protein
MTDRRNSLLKGIGKRRLFFEFLSIFIAVISAFALNNWNDYRKDTLAEKKILDEINNGLSKDIYDLKLNVKGHHTCMRACKIWNKILQGEPYKGDSLEDHYGNLTRDFINVQNIAGYAALKSRGLELVKNDKLREEIISLYEYDYNTLRKFEEEYREMQFHDSYFKTLNDILAPSFEFSSSGRIMGISSPIQINENERAIVRSIILRIYKNRLFVLQYYAQLEYKLKHLQNSIEFELEQ